MSEGDVKKTIFDDLENLEIANSTKYKVIGRVGNFGRKVDVLTDLQDQIIQEEREYQKKMKESHSEI